LLQKINILKIINRDITNIEKILRGEAVCLWNLIYTGEDNITLA